MRFALASKPRRSAFRDSRALGDWIESPRVLDSFDFARFFAKNRLPLFRQPRSSRCLVAQNGPALNMPVVGTLGQIEKSRISRFAENKEAPERHLVLLAQGSWSIQVLEKLT
jgi:hypothetical protein